MTWLEVVLVVWNILLTYGLLAIWNGSLKRDLDSAGSIERHLKYHKNHVRPSADSRGHDA